MLGHKEPSTTARFYAVFDREVDLRDVWQKRKGQPELTLSLFLDVPDELFLFKKRR
jgi:hypothetical protein